MDKGFLYAASIALAWLLILVHGLLEFQIRRKLRNSGAPIPFWITAWNANPIYDQYRKAAQAGGWNESLPTLSRAAGFLGLMVGFLGFFAFRLVK